MKDIVKNREIEHHTVKLVDETGNAKGVMPLSKAIALAEQEQQDLVQVGNSKDFAICKILDSGKLAFEMKKKKKEIDKRNRENAVNVKSLQLRPNTGENDIQTKLNQARKFIGNNDKVLFRVKMKKGREVATLQEQAREVLVDITNRMSDIAVTDKPAELQNTDMVMILAPQK